MSGPRRARSRPRGDAGAGSVLVAGLVAVGLVLASGTAVVAQAAVGAARAGAAADLAALAAADVALGRSTAEDPCAAAVRVAAAGSARVTRCEVGSGQVLVGVELPLPGVAKALGPARALARAGAGGAGSGGAGALGAPADPWTPDP